MLSFVLRRTLLRSGTLFSAPRLLPCAISPNRPLTWPVRGLTTTSGDLNSGSTADSEPESKPKSTGRKARSSKKVTDKDKTEGETKPNEKATKAKQKITIKPEHLPPKRPSAYALWFSDWFRTQPKSDSPLPGQDYIRQCAQAWHTVPEDEKQQYREKFDVLNKEYNQRMEEWRERIGPAVLREMNSVRVAKGLRRIRGSHAGRPTSGYIRYFQEVYENTPWIRAQDSHKDHFKALAGRVGSQWRAMSEAEKAKYVDPAKAEYAAWREKRKAEGHAKQ